MSVSLFVINCIHWSECGIRGAGCCAIGTDARDDGLPPRRPGKSYCLKTCKVRVPRDEAQPATLEPRPQTIDDSAGGAVNPGAAPYTVRFTLKAGPYSGDYDVPIYQVSYTTDELLQGRFSPGARHGGWVSVARGRPNESVKTTDRRHVLITYLCLGREWGGETLNVQRIDGASPKGIYEDGRNIASYIATETGTSNVLVMSGGN